MENPLVNRIDFFSEVLKSGSRLNFWQLDRELNLTKSNCDNAETLFGFFSSGKCFSYLKKYVSLREEKPLLLSNSLGMNWIATLDLQDGAVQSVYMIGPAFVTEKTNMAIRNYLQSKNFAPALTEVLLNGIRNTPVVQLLTLHQFGSMLHYTVTGKEAGVSEFNYQLTESPTSKAYSEAEAKPGPKNQTWFYEQRAMEMIENGCLEYKETFGRLSETGGAYIPNATESYLRSVKNSVLAFIAISTRASIRGGLNPEIAYAIGQRYADAAELSASIPDLANINSCMYDDFVQRVHRVKESHGLSATVSACRDYIDLHISEKISLKNLAGQFNYSESHFSQKFREETGIPVSQYIKEHRIERAKLLLETSRKSIQDISDELGFCNSSYFVETFRSVTGKTPGEFRETLTSD